VSWGVTPKWPNMEIVNKIIADKIMNNLSLFDFCHAFGRAAKEKNDFVGNDFVTSPLGFNQ
jgi:hypothetical protein